MSGPLDCESVSPDCCGAKLASAGVVPPRPAGWCNETLHRWFGGFGRSPVTLLVGKRKRREPGAREPGAAPNRPVNARPPFGYTSAAVLSFGVLTAWAVGWVWHELDRLQQDFRVVQSESFHLAEHLEEKMLSIKSTLQSLEIRPEPGVVADFGRQVQEMRRWIRTNRPLVASAQQREVLDRIGTAFEGYVTKTTPLLDNNMRAGPNAKPAPVLVRVEPEIASVLGLARDLRAAEQSALDRFVTGSQRSIGNLQLEVVVALVLAFILGITALRLIHIARIAPLKAELRQSHSILAQKEKLALLGTLAAGVAHEVRNPLTAIKVRLHSLERVLLENASTDEDLSVIHNEISRLEDFVGDFLGFARPAAPRMQPFAVAGLFAQVHRLLSSQIEAAGIRWHIEVSPEVCLLADGQQIEQVLINLIQNAVENTERGGTITLRAEHRQPHPPSGTTAAIVLAVADTGKGIPPETAARIFEPFFSTKKNGTGLGLSIAARIVEAHGGSLQYRTEPGHGTTFSILLPNTGGSLYDTQSQTIGDRR